MDGSGVNSANIASAVWNATVRQLTGLGTTTLNVGTGNSRTTVANGTSVFFTTGSGKCSFAFILGIPLANVTWSFQATNNTLSDAIATGASGAALSLFFINNNGFGVLLSNGGTVSGTYSGPQIVLSQ